jgi:outer membrane protein
MKQKIYLSLIILFYISSNIKAQKSTSETYSFSMQQCIDFAAKNQMDIVNSRYDEVIAKAKVNEILGSGLPQVNGSVNLNDFLQIPTQLIPGEFFGGKPGTFIPIKFGTQYNTTADLTISQLLFDGTYIVGLQASHTYLELAQKNSARTKIETASTVMKAYYSVLIAEEKMNLIEANVIRLKKLFDDTKALNDNGMVEKIDLDRVSVAYNNIKVEKDKMVRLIALSYNLLKYQMGMDLKATLTLTDKLNSLELVNWDVNTDGFDYTKRIEYSLMETERKLGEFDLKRYKMTYYPSLVAFADVSENLYENKFDISGSQKWYETELIGAKLTIPIFDAQQKHSRVVQAQFNLKKLESQQKNLENSLNLQLTSAKTTYDNSVANLKVQKDNITLAENVYNVTKTKYENGIGSNLEVVTAQTALKEAQDNYYGALYDAIVAKVDLDKALGNIK